ncbi:MAG: ribosome silencing factor [Phycisphaeraceae bacterium]
MPTPKKKTTRKAAKKATAKVAKPVEKALAAPPAEATPKPRKRSKPAAEEGRKFAIEAARLMRDLHCEHIDIFDVRGKSDVMDFLLIGSGTSDRQMRSVADDLVKLGKQHKLQAFGRHVDGPTTWVVIDLVDVVIHLFEPQTRAFYDLEMLWGDAPKVEWER